MSLVSGTIRLDEWGSRPRAARLRARLTLLLAVVLSVVLAGSALAQSQAPGPSPLPDASTGPAASTAPVSLEGTPWTLAEPLLGNPYRVTLLLRDGMAMGTSSCNDYLLPYTLTGSAIAFGLPGVTFPPRTCDAAAAAYETAYLAKLSTVGSFVILDGRLLLVDGTGTVALTYVAEPERAVEGDWVVSGFRAPDGSTAALVPGTTLTLALMPDGTADGYAGCSRFATTYAVDADALSFGPIAAPLITCPHPDVQAQSDGYLAALDSVRSWSWDGVRLVLSSAPDAPAVELIPAGPPAFVGTWIATAIAGPDGSLRPPVDGSAPTLDILSGDSVTGSTGCNAMFGHLWVAGPAIGIGPIATTRVACSTAELTSQETAYLAALTAAAAWTVEDGELSLFGRDGSSLMTLVAATVIPVPSPSPEATATPTPEPTASPSPRPTAKPTPKPTPGTVAVPDVVGDTEQDALVAFGSAGVKAGSKSSTYDKAKKGIVIATDPKAGVVVKRGTAVDYTVSKGPQPTPSPTAKPTAKPTPKPTAKPTPKPTAKPTPKPTAKPTPKPTAKPTPKPTAKPTPKPTAKPTPKPTAKPTPKPTAKPTPKPTAKPTPKPTAKPTPKPTARPSGSPADLLDGTSWILSRFDDGAGDVISVPVQDETPKASFGSGTISGFTGCNAFSGSYALDGSKMDIGPLKTTSKACDDLGTAVEAIFLGSMDQVTKWKVNDKGKLVLRGGDGAPVLTFTSLLK